MDYTVTYFLGILATGLMIYLTKRAVETQFNGKGTETNKRSLYRSDHSILNISLPPQSMWMNMGFWKDTNDFPTACRALLEEVLKSAQILGDGSLINNEKVTKTLSIVDLGYGSGDQSLYLKNEMRKQRQMNGGYSWRRLLQAYVGITLEGSHFDIAQERLDLDQSGNDDIFKIYCADAGRPESWSPELSNAVSLACRANQEKGDHENWVLALDTLYHFHPSRWPIIEYANRTLEASVMAFDLCLAGNLSFWQRVMVRLMALFGQSPLANWVTIDQYRERLVAAGYRRERIEILDVSEHVFGPLAEYIKRRDLALQRYGLSIGRYLYAAKMFAWWHRTGMVRGCIIVARK